VKLSKEAKIVFMKARDISDSNSMQSHPELGKAVGNLINTQGYKVDIQQSQTRMSNQKRQNSCICKTVIKNTDCYIRLSDLNTKDNQETRNPNPFA
jgi:hypothetical protein